MTLIEETLRAYEASFDSTFALLDELLASEKHVQEIILIVCARLDAMAMTAAPLEQSNKRAFINFAISYGGQRDLLESISVGELYFSLYAGGWQLPATIPTPGRLHRYSREDDDLFALLDQSGVPLTENDCRILINRILVASAPRFRVRPNQKRRRPFSGQQDLIQTMVTSAFDTPRWRNHKADITAGFRALLDEKRIVNLLYSRYRNTAIHRGRVQVDETKFFSEQGIYWT